MFKKIKPDIFVTSLQDIPVQELREQGIRGLIIDLDNTLTHWNCTEIEPMVCDWLNHLIELGFKLCVVSNNSAKRIGLSLNKLQIPFVSNALKPSKWAFLKAMEILKTPPQKTAVIGDQLFTDIWGGKRAGVTTILVRPLSKKEFLGTKIMRKVERVILNRFL